MAQPYIGEIRMFGGNFPPLGWLFCEGQQLPISENEALFQLIGTTYGGDGESTFNLPDLQGRIPIHFGNASSGTTYPLAQMAGVEEVTLTSQQIPVHNHPAGCKGTDGNSASPIGGLPAVSIPANAYGLMPPSQPMNAAAVVPVGGSQPHTNFQPYLCINFIISLFGIFPSPS
ncbi:MAG TPA: tail fiber protein [Pyrinomonadaceae bacterium]|jgi:microcystin-dependent protein